MGKAKIKIYVVNIVTLVVGLLIFYYFSCDIKILGSIVATGISISFGLLNYQIENDKIFKSLFTEFNTKYDDKFNDKLNKFKRAYQEGELKFTGDDINLIIDYLNFCAEEYLWYKKGRIENDVWMAWESGMKYYLNLPPIREIVEREREQKESYYKLLDDKKIIK